VQWDGDASPDAVGTEDSAQLRQQRVQARVHCRRVGFAPLRLVARDQAVPVQNQVGEEQAALAAGKIDIDPLPAAVYDKRATDIDPQHG
jgi:hypothetical protein